MSRPRKGSIKELERRKAEIEAEINARREEAKRLALEQMERERQVRETLAVIDSVNACMVDDYIDTDIESLNPRDNLYCVYKSKEDGDIVLIAAV